MGNSTLNSIIVTGFFNVNIVPIWEKAVEIFGEEMVTKVLITPMNGFKSFFVGPHGNSFREPVKEEALKRDMFVEYLEDLSWGNILYWVEVSYNIEDSEEFARIERTS